MTKLYLFERRKELFPETLLEALPPWRREKAERLRNVNSRQESMAAGLLWRLAMEEWGVDPMTAVELLPAGKPCFSTGTGPRFSLSHSGACVLCAVSDGDIGCDVQQMRKVNLSVARRLHPEERLWLEALEERERQREFFRLWARKEAWVKAESGERMLSLGEVDVMHPLAGWFFRDYALFGEYRAAVCARERDLPEPILVARERLIYW